MPSYYATIRALRRRNLTPAAMVPDDPTIILKPKRPIDPKWCRMPDRSPVVRGTQPVEHWYHAEARLHVLSAVEVVAPEHGAERLGPEYHVSISKAGLDGQPGRCDSQEAREVLRAFGMEDAEEDNHVPGGFVRNFWMSVAHKFVGYECPCKDAEPAIREDKGDFTWRPASP